MLRFHLDENVDHAIAVGLRRRAIDVTTTEEMGMRGASDAEQLAFGLRQNRVIVTHDDDLLALHAEGSQHAGVAFNKLRTRTIGQIILKLVALSRNFDPPDMFGRVEFL